MTCGCKVESTYPEDVILYCPLHAAAPEMLTALTWAMTHVENVFALAGRHDRERPELDQARALLEKIKELP